MSEYSLANAELAVMEFLWEKGGGSAREIREELYSDAVRSQHGTVQRLLKRLEDKGFVVRDDRVGIHLFSPRIGRQEYAVSQMEALANKLTSGSFAPLISHLVEHEKISDAESARIRDLLASHGQRDTGS